MGLGKELDFGLKGEAATQGRKKKERNREGSDRKRRIRSGGEQRRTHIQRRELRCEAPKLKSKGGS